MQFYVSNFIYFNFIAIFIGYYYTKYLKAFEVAYFILNPFWTFLYF